MADAYALMQLLNDNVTIILINGASIACTVIAYLFQF